MEPPYKCLFCLRTDVSFSRVEHPVPESLGNDDWVLPTGFVCDECNQYFGSKVENKVISEPPFILERLGYFVKTKKGRLPKYEARKGLHLVPCGIADTLLFVAEEDYVEHYHASLGRKPFMVYQSEQVASHISRFLIKIGLEAMIDSLVDPYSPIFDAAREHARRGRFGNKWQVGYAFYPHRGDLEISTRYDEFGPLVTRQLYEWSMGALPSGDISMSFIYGQHIFACNLSQPSIVEHLIGFNLRNDITMHFYTAEINQRVIVQSGSQRRKHA